MTSFNWMFVGSLLVLLLLNGWVSYKVACSSWFERTQRFYQLLIVWLLPFLGALGVGLLLKSFSEPSSAGGKSFGGGANDTAKLTQTGDPD